jgi:hypothetical protein
MNNDKNGNTFSVSPERPASFSEAYDDAVGDVAAAIEKLESLKSRIEGDNSWTTRDEDDEDDRIGEIDEQIQNLQTMVDFDHQSLDLEVA